MIKTGVIVKLEPTDGPRLFWNPYKITKILKEDYGIKSWQYKIDLINQIISGPDKSIPISLTISKTLNGELELLEYAKYRNSDEQPFVIKVFEAADDESALLLNEIGEIGYE